ncbi:MAG: winged helix-turn-helix transcriptional regulator [Oscillospiraceae bacterium]|nr:winged helix-turn-helix transcriptional regulator [Oscillospiraceae bacterium]
MAEKSTEYNLLTAWVKLSGILKNNRITKGLLYNEATVMLLLYSCYTEDGVGLISIKEIIAQTGMLKSLVNRTINSLEKKGLLVRQAGEKDKRTLYVRCVEEKLDVFLQVHASSLGVAKGILDIIGPEDAETFIRIVEKLDKAGYKL